MRIWIDDVRLPPEDYLWCQSVVEAKDLIVFIEEVLGQYGRKSDIELIDIDHDAGDYAQYGGDYIKLLDWFEETGRSYPIRIHSMNPVGVENMRRIIQKNGWTEVR